MSSEKSDLSQPKCCKVHLLQWILLFSIYAKYQYCSDSLWLYWNIMSSQDMMGHDEPRSLRLWKTDLASFCRVKAATGCATSPHVSDWCDNVIVLKTQVIWMFCFFVFFVLTKLKKNPDDTAPDSFWLSWKFTFEYAESAHLGSRFLSLSSSKTATPKLL